ncbi:Arc family DNA-binding protein [Giesbergeria anulus]|uniref:Arc-like DNA binding domain-containing protein n=1 Tax=Giesbergeria anulus TaxID=180197 RepID=A0A1H9E1B0_9BURK|nr:Arc family DNA-binding protein [Giesbergeria anulus]SEQ19516.1 Arc-like DNA binding domain-containing protein [Giesbergeria anulus]
MSREDPQMKIRLPAELKDHIEASAKQLGRSMNSEIVARLKATILGYIDVDGSKDLGAKEIERLTKELSDLRGASTESLGKLSSSIQFLVGEVAENKKISFEDALLLCVARGSAMTTGVPAVVFQFQQGTTISEMQATLREASELLPADCLLGVEQVPEVITRALK